MASDIRFTCLDYGPRITDPLSRSVVTRARYSAVIFDLDGTLIDSEPVFNAVAKLAALDFDRCFTDELYLDLIGLPGVEVENGILDAFGHDFPLQAFRERFAAYWEEHVEVHGIEVKPGVVDLIDRLDALAIPYAVATSTPHDRAVKSLHLACIGHRFEILIGGDEIDNGKPAPDIYLHAAKLVATDASQCIAIEDSKVGVRAAAAANMYTIMVPDLKPPDAQTQKLASEILPSMAAASERIIRLLSD